MLQIRITEFDGTDPIILDQAEDKSYSKEVNFGDEGISFSVAKNSYKADVLNPDTTGYKKRWEVWDTRTNTRKNYGPITNITEDGSNWKVTGAGRTALLNNFIKSVKTFYTPLDTILDDLRYENVAIQPRTTTLVPVDGDSGTIFSAFSPNAKFYGLSKQTKDNAIDDNDGLIKPGQIEPPNTYFTTQSYWAGQSTEDTHIVDLGGTYDISKITLKLPWWGGAQKLNNRTFDFNLAYATSLSGVTPQYQLRNFSNWTELYDTGANNRFVANPAYRFYIGTTVSGSSVELGTIYVAQNVPGPIEARYIRTNITDVHAWYGTIYDDNPPHDGYLYQCWDGYTAGDDPTFGDLEGIMHGKTINERVLEASNDCNASIVELGAYQEIISRDIIEPLALQRIDNNNLQIKYTHYPDAGETITTSEGFRKFEPGGFFKRYRVSWSGAGTSYTKFFNDDCTNCYPDGFNFGILDQNNSMIYQSDTSSATDVSLRAPAYSSLLLMKGSSSATVTYCDSWPAVTDAFSWGTSYSYTEKANDTVTCHFRGQSFKWYATIPYGKTGATVKIEIRQKAAPSFSGGSWSNSAWGSWSTLVNSMILPNNVAAEPVYEISYESGYLQAETVYEIRITNLDGNFCSVDSFEGYWSGSMTTYNEDSHRIFVSDVAHIEQIYDKRFSGGSMYKIPKPPSRMAFVFTGDRVILYSAKGRHHGKMRVALLRIGSVGSIYDNNADGKIEISGGDANRILTVDLNTGKRGNEIPQYIAFDSDEHVPGGLPWDRYQLHIAYAYSDRATFNTTDTSQFENFVDRCDSCTEPTGDTIEVVKPIFVDGISAHEVLGLSVSFDNETHLTIAKNITEALQIEGDITDDGLLIKPRVGQDTDVVLREGQNTVINYNLVNDISQIASMLVSNGSDIDGLPLFTITEDKATREDLGRTIMRKEDFRNVADYFQLIGLSRTSLRKRKKPEKRITVTHIGDDFYLEQGDTFILYTRKMGPLRVRINRIQIIESSNSGTTVEMECVRWPQII